MARYFVAIDLLRKLALVIEEGITIDEEDPDMNIDLHYLFHNFAYGQKMETSFYAPHPKGSFLLLSSGKHFILFYSQFKIAIAFLLNFGLDGYFVSLWEDW